MKALALRKSPKSTIHRVYNITESIIVEAERCGLEALATGGNMDYICKKIGGNDDGSSRIVILCDAKYGGSPDRLSDRVDVQIMLSQDWMEAVAIPVKTAKEGMALMARMFDPYAMPIKKED